MQNLLLFDLDRRREQRWQRREQRRRRRVRGVAPVNVHTADGADQLAEAEEAVGERVEDVLDALKGGGLLLVLALAHGLVEVLGALQTILRTRKWN